MEGGQNDGEGERNKMNKVKVEGFRERLKRVCVCEFVIVLLESLFRRVKKTVD